MDFDLTIKGAFDPHLSLPFKGRREDVSFHFPSDWRADPKGLMAQYDAQTCTLEKEDSGPADEPVQDTGDYPFSLTTLRPIDPTPPRATVTYRRTAFSATEGTTPPPDAAR